MEVEVRTALDRIELRVDRVWSEPTDLIESFDIGGDISIEEITLLSDASQYVTGQTLMVDGGGIMRA